jgi:hypothetical protein
MKNPSNANVKREQLEHEPLGEFRFLRKSAGA